MVSGARMLVQRRRDLHLEDTTRVRHHSSTVDSKAMTVIKTDMATTATMMVMRRIRVDSTRTLMGELPHHRTFAGRHQEEVALPCLVAEEAIRLEEEGLVVGEVLQTDLVQGEVVYDPRLTP